MSKVEGLDFTEEQMKNASAEIVNGWRDYVSVVEDLFKQGKYGELQTEAYDVYRRCLSAIKLAEEGAKERGNATYLSDKGENVIEKRLQRLEDDRLKIENNIKDLENFIEDYRDRLNNLVKREIELKNKQLNNNGKLSKEELNELKYVISEHNYIMKDYEDAYTMLQSTKDNLRIYEEYKNEEMPALLYAKELASVNNKLQKYEKAKKTLLKQIERFTKDGIAEEIVNSLKESLEDVNSKIEELKAQKEKLISGTKEEVKEEINEPNVVIENPVSNDVTKADTINVVNPNKDSKIDEEIIKPEEETQEEVKNTEEENKEKVENKEEVENKEQEMTNDETKAKKNIFEKGKEMLSHLNKEEEADKTPRLISNIKKWVQDHKKVVKTSLTILGVTFAAVALAGGVGPAVLATIGETVGLGVAYKATKSK